jgi:hypothetical protein
MVEGALKGLFGGGDDDEKQRGQVQDFISRYDDGDPSEGYDENEAREHYARAAQQATPEEMERATRRSLEKLPENQRAQLSEMLRQRQAGQGGVDIQRSGDQSGSAGGGGIEDLLGGMMGGGGGRAGGSGGGLGDILGGLMGGGATGRGGAVDRGSAGGGLGDLMSSPAGKALVGGIAAFALKEVMDRR